MRIIIALGLFLFPVLSYSQLFRKDVLSSSGDYLETSNYAVGWTVGEIAVEVFSSTSDNNLQGYWYTCAIPGQLHCLASVDDYSLDEWINFYPNPSPDVINIEIISDEPGTGLKVQIADMTGQVLITENIEINGISSISLYNLSSGTYIISVFNENKILKHQKIQKL